VKKNLSKTNSLKCHYFIKVHFYIIILGHENILQRIDVFVEYNKIKSTVSIKEEKKTVMLS